MRAATFRRLFAVSLGCLFAAIAPSQAPTPYIVADLAPGIGAGDADPSPGVERNGRLVFFGRSTAGSWLPFLTDGTFGGTTQLLGVFSTQPPLAARVGNYVVFGVDLPDGSSDVWSTDGTNAGTRRILQGYGVSAVPDRWHGGAWIVFGAKRGTRSYLYRTDGQVCEYAGSAAPSHLTAVRWQFGPVVRHVTFYAATSAATGREPWFVESGPGPFGTTVPALVQDLSPGVASGFAAPADSTGFATWVDPASGELYVATIGDHPFSGAEVRRLRRTFATPFVLLPLQEVAPGAAGAAPRDLVARGEEVLFAATNATSGSEPWRLSLTTGQLTAFNLEVGPASSNPRGFVALPSPSGAPLPDVWFQAEVSGPGRELWRYDGSTASMLLDLNPLRNSSDPVVLGFADGQVFFAADHHLSGRELWRTDGTPAGTALAFDAVAGPDSSDPTACGVIDVGGTPSLLYAAASPYGRELHRVDAATTAPVLVRNLSGQPTSSAPQPVFAWGSGPQTARWADGRALLFADSALWVADGQPGVATRLLTQAAANGNLLLAVPGQAVTFDDGTALFLVQGVLGTLGSAPRLWVTDGTLAGTHPAGALSLLGLQSPLVYGLFEFGGNVYFGMSNQFLQSAADVTSIWRTNRLGATPQQAVGSAQGITAMREWRVVGDRIFLAGERTDGSTGRELWVWQPPNAPTLVADIRPGSQGSNPRWLVAFRNRCYFVANDGVHGEELWASNGLAGGTFLVKDANPGPASGAFGPLVPVATSSLVYAGDDGVNGREPWRSNGVQAGTQMIADLRPGPDGSAPGSITPVHVGVFACTADDGAHGRELWRIDTTTGPTLYDLRPGPVGSNPSHLTWSTRHLFFAAEDGVSGKEPWYASWIDFQTVAMLADLSPGSASSISSYSQAPMPAGQQVLFAADNGDGVTGTELYAIDMTGASSPIGTSCVQPFQVMELRSTAPRLGQGLTYWVSDPGTGVPATTLLSPKPSTPGGLTLPGIACPIWVDPNSYVVVDQFTTPGSFTRTVPVPLLPTMLGAVMRMQCVFDYPPMLATNGLELVVGN